MIRVDKRIFDSPGRPWPYVDDKPCICMNCPECRGYVMDVRANQDCERDTSGWKPSGRDLLEQVAAINGDPDYCWDEGNTEPRTEKTYLRTYDDMRLPCESENDLESRMLAMTRMAEARAQRAAERSAAQAEARAKRAEERLAGKTRNKLEDMAERRSRKMKDLEQKVKRMEEMLANMKSTELNKPKGNTG